jgi:hypothetical protein
MLLAMYEFLYACVHGGRHVGMLGSMFIIRHSYTHSSMHLRMLVNMWACAHASNSVRIQVGMYICWESLMKLLDVLACWNECAYAG